MLPPFFYKGVSDEGLYAYYAEIIEQVNEDNLAIYLYHIPPISQIPLSTDLVKRLATEYPDNIAGIKDSSGDWKQTAAFNEMNIPNFRVFCGSESFLLKNMRAGGAGCISATANVNALAINDLFENWDSDRAESLQESIDQIRNIFQSYPMIPALKTAITLQSRDEEWSRVRPPLTTLTKDQISALNDELSTAGFTMDGIARHV